MLGGMTEILITACASVAAAAIASLATILVKRRPAALTAEAAWQLSNNDGFAKLNAALMKRMEEQDEVINALRGEIENLTQHVYSLENILRENGQPIPVRQRPAVFSVVPK